MRNLIETNVVGTLDLLQRAGRRMRAEGSGRILITGSIAGLIPGAYQAACNASKASLENFSYALRNELRDTGMTVTCLMRGATGSNFRERAETTDTLAGVGSKDLPDAPAHAGWEAMKTGAAQVSLGWLNTLERAILHIVPETAKAALNACMMRPDDSEVTHG